MKADRLMVAGGVVLAGVLLWSVPGRADTVLTYGTSKDAELGTYSGSGGNGNGGQSARLRLGKPGGTGILGQNYAIFDWNRVTITNNLNSWSRSNGWANIQDAYNCGAIKAEMGGRAADDDAVKSVQVGFFESSTAWVEGSGTDSDTAYNWATNSSAATDTYAVNWRPGDTLAGTRVSWQSNGVAKTTFRGLPFQWNSAMFSNFVSLSYTYVVLDTNVWWNYLNSTKAGPGLVTRNGGTGGKDGTRFYARDQSPASSYNPVLRFTIRKRQTGTIISLTSPPN